MSNEKILKKAISKAVKNGYDKFSLQNIEDFTLLKACYEKKQGNRYYYSLIFSHDFAISFWGEEEKFKDPRVFVGNGNGTASRPILGFGWQFHLQQMVLLEDDEKFKYLEKFL